MLVELVKFNYCGLQHDTFEQCSILNQTTDVSLISTRRYASSALRTTCCAYPAFPFTRNSWSKHLHDGQSRPPWPVDTQLAFLTTVYLSKWDFMCPACIGQTVSTVVAAQEINSNYVVLTSHTHTHTECFSSSYTRCFLWKFWSKMSKRR